MNLESKVYFTKGSDGMQCSEIESLTAASAIPGWMTKKELKWLIKEAAAIPANSAIVEIGSYKGRSSIAIAKAMRSDAVFYCVDTWSGDPEEPEEMKSHYYIDWLKNLFEHAFRKSIIPIRLPSASAVTLFPRESVDWVFIDGCHAYEQVKSDITLWKSRLKQGGLLSGHDYVSDCPGVMKAVNELCEQVTFCDKIWYCRL